MLILSRKIHESIQIGGDITVSIVKLTAGNVKLGFTAPKDVNIVRSEIAEEVDQTSNTGVEYRSSVTQ